MKTTEKCGGAWLTHIYVKPHLPNCEGEGYKPLLIAEVDYTGAEAAL